MIKKRNKKTEAKYGNEVEERIAEAIREGKPLSGKEGILTPIIKRALEAALEGEMEGHLKQDKESLSSNRRNGK